MTEMPKLSVLRQTCSIWVMLVVTVTVIPVQAQLLQPFSKAQDAQPPALWKLVGLPDKKVPLTSMEVVTVDRERVLRLRTENSYGVLSHPVDKLEGSAILQWRWRVDQPVPGADLQRKSGDDSAIKVCAMFDFPLERLGLFERNLLRLARQASKEQLPAATVCYVWDATLPVGMVLANAYTSRLRWLVLDSGGTPLGQWRTHRRNLRADLIEVFGEEAKDGASLVAIAVGADADNTRSESLAYLTDLTLETP